MEKRCENLVKCGFFMNYSGNNEVIKQGWIRMYCENYDKSEKCERKKMKKKTGSPPPDNMTPTGKFLK